MSTTAVTGQAFKTALRIDVTTKPQRAQQVAISTPVDAAIANGDVLMISFWMRSGAPGEATLDAAFRAPMAMGARGARGGVPGAPGAAGPPPAGGPPAGAPGAQGAAGAAGRAGGAAGGGGFVGGFGFGGRGGLNAPAAAGAAWKKITLPFAVNRDYAKGEAEVVFTLGMKAQTVEIGGIELLNYGTSRKVADLPFTRIGYQGSEPTAAWRKAAEARIEKVRKGDLTVLVKDGAGKPVSGAQVAVRMKKHAFLWGTAVNASAFSNGRMTPENLERYKQEILKNFNASVMENENKWPQWSNVANRPATIKVIDWLRDNGVKVRGHNLVWPSWNNSNVKEALEAKGNPPQLAKVILDHISETTRELRGKFIDWDVINETFTNHDFMDILGRQVMVDWFKAARAGDPDAKLYINDFNIIEGDDKAHQDDYAATIKYLLDAGAPVDGIGLQGHFPSRVTPMDELIRRVERYAAFGKETGGDRVRHQHLRRGHAGRLHARLHDLHVQQPLREGVRAVGLLGRRALDSERRDDAARLVAQAQRHGLPGSGVQEVVDQCRRQDRGEGRLHHPRVPGRLRHRGEGRRQDQNGESQPRQRRQDRRVRAGLTAVTRARVSCVDSERGRYV